MDQPGGALSSGEHNRFWKNKGEGEQLDKQLHRGQEGTTQMKHIHTPLHRSCQAKKEVEAQKL